MNRWECEACDQAATGIGGAIGLRAIGWYFRPGPVILCPRHRPDRVECRDRPGVPCAICAAEAEAQRAQALILAADNA